MGSRANHTGAEASIIRRHLSALSRFYRCAAGHDLLSTTGVTPPVVDAEYTDTTGLDRDQTRALLAAADTGARAAHTGGIDHPVRSSTS